MTQLFANNAKTRLNAGITNVATSLTVIASEGGQFPSPTGGDYFLCTLFSYSGTDEVDHEIVKVTARTGDTFTIERAQESTTAQAWGSGTPVELRVTSATLDSFHTAGDVLDAGAATVDSLNVGGGNITNVGNVDGVDVSALQTQVNGIDTLEPAIYSDGSDNPQLNTGISATEVRNLISAVQTNANLVYKNVTNTWSTTQTFEDGALHIEAGLHHSGDPDTYLRFDTNRVRLFAGGTTVLDANTTTTTVNGLAVAWGDLTGVPSTFTPSAHTHTKSEITDFGVTWAEVTGKPSTFTPSAHTHVVADITDFDPADYLLNTTDTFTGTLTLNGKLDITGDNWVETIFVSSNPGQQLVLCAGESKSQLDGVTGGNPLTGENVYVVAENGLEIHSSPGNWTTGGSYDDATWALRNTAIICDTTGASSLPGDLTVQGDVTLEKLIDDSGKVIYGSADNWLRLNGEADFTSGIYGGATGVFRHDGGIEVGASGASFDVTSAGTVAAAGRISGANLRTAANGVVDGTSNGTYNYYKPIDTTDSNRATIASISHMAFLADGNDNGTGDFNWRTGSTTFSSADNIMTLTNAGNLSVVGTLSDSSGNVRYTHPTYSSDDINLDTGALSGATVISDLDFNVTTDTLGHVTDANATYNTRNITLANLGYTGATNANNYSHPNHTGDVTSSGDGATTIQPTAISNRSALTSGLSSTDELLVRDVSPGDLKRMDISVLQSYMQSNLSFGSGYTHPTYNGDDFSVDTGALSGATVVSDIDINVTTDTQGHVTDCNGSVSTRTLTLANLGYTGATNATANSGTSTNLSTLTGGDVLSSMVLTNGSIQSYGVRTMDAADVGAPETDGTGATGTWGISISGNAATATSATSCTNATNSTNLNITTEGSGTKYLCYASGTGNQRLGRDGSLYWDPSGNQLNAVTFNATSDPREKKNIHDYVPDAAHVIPAKIYDWKKEARGKDQIGYISTDVKQVFPQAVATNEDTGLESVNYIMVHTAKIAELESEVAELKALVHALLESK